MRRCRNTRVGWWSSKRGTRVCTQLAYFPRFLPTLLQPPQKELCYCLYLFIHYAWPIYTVVIEEEWVKKGVRENRRGRKWQFTKAGNWVHITSILARIMRILDVWPHLHVYSLWMVHLHTRKDRRREQVLPLSTQRRTCLGASLAGIYYYCLPHPLLLCVCVCVCICDSNGRLSLELMPLTDVIQQPKETVNKTMNCRSPMRSIQWGLLEIFSVTHSLHIYSKKWNITWMPY